ncbi:MAG: single-stranded DNA-binding protein [Actinobacteria bacterium]|nr:single-stranded DNA-binding protein [Actinomycetota bacterium]
MSRLFPGNGRTAGRPASRGGTDVLMDCLDHGEDLNRAVLSGLIAAAPQRDTSRDGDPITVFSLSFVAPHERLNSGLALCEVAILDELADRYRRQLKLGASVLVVGELMGAEGLWANALAVKTSRTAY